jgi:hypothetical protein
MTYARKAKIAAWLENAGIRAERDGDQLFAYELKPHVTDEHGVWHPVFERVEMHAMQDAIALKRRMDT